MRSTSVSVPSAFDAHGKATTRVRSESLPLEVGQVEASLVVDDDEVDLQAEVARELEPRSDVGVVVEPRDEDLVARLELPPERAREHEVQRRHVRAEDDLLGLPADESRSGRAGLFDNGVGAPARREEAAGVRVRLAEVAGDRLDHLVGNLGPAGAVEERRRAGERREARADGGDVEQRCAHARDAICAVRGPSYGRAVRRLRELSEAECYARCYGSGDEGVRVVKIEPRRVEVRWTSLR